MRRAVGARRKDILVQFLVESSFLGILGGLAGIALGLIASQILKIASGMPLVLSLNYMLGSLIFSVVIGLIFGIYPSWKAAGLDPIEALNSKT